VLSFRGRLITRERLGLVPRLVGLLGLLTLAAWVFSGARQQSGPEEFSSAWVVKAQLPPKKQGSALPEAAASLLSPEPLNPPPMAERPPSAVVTVTPPYDVVDVRTIRAGGRTIMLAGIEGLNQNATCRARDGTRWSCAKLAKDALRSRIGNQSLSCSPGQEASATVLVATCTTRAGDDLAHALVAEGWARASDDAPQRYGAEMAAAEQQGLGLWGWRMEGQRKGR
jgi:endonuclease YncB( thermonuclease family)